MDYEIELTDEDIMDLTDEDVTGVIAALDPFLTHAPATLAEIASLP